MYTIAIHVPIFIQGNELLIATDWKRSLYLLRDSLEGKLGPIHVIAPHRHAQHAEQILETLDKDSDITLTPSVPRNIRTREYWLKHRKQWLTDVTQVISKSKFVHTGCANPFRPFMFDALKIAVAQNKPTLITRDTDTVLQVKELVPEDTTTQRLEKSLYLYLFNRNMNWAVAHASLSLLKGEALMKRYGDKAKNAKEIHNTSYSIKNVIPEEKLHERLKTLESPRPPRLVYCGRFEPRKGVLDSLKLIRHARDQHDMILHLDLIGDGEQHAELEAYVRKHHLTDQVHFVNKVPYGQGLFDILYTYDALLFTPVGEDTPRMIFDAYAAGLPLIGSDISYNIGREKDDHAALILPRNDLQAALAKIKSLYDNPQKLISLSLEARKAGLKHTAENWYKKRAAWTLEAYEKHIRSTPSKNSAA
ncbi:glycosyltransferase family 4 protein [Poriferisphaera sp. WC338]|uniref:glycosyltransferase family 4 protein n=1 Tax=Poriferisphaera sp. WC338 TaxID=3425129 RepID=UPI003D819089